jgi:hypothetical protein
MQIAYYMGFDNIFLIGVDHSFVVGGDPNEVQILSGSDPNHFDSSYFSNQKWNLPDLEGSEESYQMAASSFVEANKSIYDATIDGKLNVFPKISFDQALSMCKKKTTDFY